MVLINGSATTALTVTDRAIQYGDGLFTTLAVSRGVPLLWSLHLARLHQGVERLRLPAFDDELLRDEVGLVAAGTDCIVKIILSRGPGGRGYGTNGSGPLTRIVTVHPLPAHRQQWRDQGIHMQTLALRMGHQPLLAGLKSLNRLEQVLARQEVEERGVDEGLCLDLQQRVVEATAANLWWYAGGHWHTPALHRCGVAGVMRALLLERLGPKLTKDARRATVVEAEEVMVTNAVFGVVPVRQLDERRWQHWPQTAQLQGQLASVMI